MFTAWATAGNANLSPPWGQTEFQVNLKLGLTPHACIQSPGHSQDGPSNHAPTRSVCTAAAVASLRARFSHSCGINVSLASLGRYARTCERYHGLFSPGSRPTGSSQTLSASPLDCGQGGRAGSWCLGPRSVYTRLGMVGFQCVAVPLVAQKSEMAVRADRLADGHKSFIAKRLGCVP